MPESLISICAERQSLDIVDVDSLYYPETGAATLASMEIDHFWFTARRSVVKKLINTARLRANVAQTIHGLDIARGTGYTAVLLTEIGIPT